MSNDVLLSVFNILLRIMNFQKNTNDYYYLNSYFLVRILLNRVCFIT